MKMLKLKKMVMFSLLLVGCAQISHTRFKTCLLKCDVQSYINLDKCTWLSGTKFYKCYASQLLRELRCDQSCHYRIEKYIEKRKTR